MLINGQRAEELRVAIVNDGALEDFQIEVAESGLTRGNIYRGRVANIEPSLNAAFVDFGHERHGFLAAHDILPQAWHRKPPEDITRPRVDQILERGKDILIQVTKDAEGQKGAALTTNISIAGRYLVLLPFDSESRGISRKADDSSRKKLKETLSKLEVPEGFGFIVRTNAIDQTKTALNRDLNALLRLWKQVKTESSEGKGHKLLYSDQDLMVTALRDYLDASVSELLIDDDDLFEKAQIYMRAFLPRAKTELIRYRERIPLFSRYNLEPQIARIYKRTVSLPAGGSIVIDRTEALTAIDVNSGKATRGATHEETIFNTNMEAAEEVGRQLRLRDIGGLVVVDFIDMRIHKHKREVEKALKESMKSDKARVSIGRISPNGLLEINRQRIKQELRLRTQRVCPTCDGVGRIASPELVAVSIIRRIEARAATGQFKVVQIALHPELADDLQNSRRQELAALEREFDVRIEIESANNLHRSEEEITWLRKDTSADKQVETGPSSVATVTDMAASAGLADAPEGPPKKKRRRRRRKKKGPGEGPESSEGTDASMDESPDASFDPAHAEGGDDPPARAVASPVDDLDDDEELEAEAEAEAENEADEAPRKRRRRRRRRKPRSEGQGGSESGSGQRADSADGGEADSAGEGRSHGHSADEMRKKAEELAHPEPSKPALPGPEPRKALPADSSQPRLPAVVSTDGPVDPSAHRAQGGGERGEADRKPEGDGPPSGGDDPEGGEGGKGSGWIKRFLGG